jgi:c-di-GMP-binding flagellar brake protein YcgR
MFQTLKDDSYNNKLSPDETSIFHKNKPFLNDQLNFDLRSHFIDLDHKKNEEDDFNVESNQSFINILDVKTTNFKSKQKDNHCSLRYNNTNNSDAQDLIIYTFEDI